MTDYRIILYLDSALELPVNPEKLEVQSGGANDTATVLKLGQVVVPRLKELRKIQFEGFFPVNSDPYVTGPSVDPLEAVKMIQSYRDQKKPFSFVLTGGDLDINTEMVFDDFDYYEQYGDVGDIWYSLSLMEYRDYSAKRLQLSGNGAASAGETQRPGEPNTSAGDHYTVQSGDCLWNIAKALLGDGSRWKEIYDLNTDKVSNPNLIYPGQELTLP